MCIKSHECSTSIAVHQCLLQILLVLSSVIIIKDGIKVDHTDSKTIASNSAKSLLSTCRSTVQKQLDNNPDLLSIPTILDSFSDCVEQGIVNEIEKANEEITFQASVRTEMGELLEDYACADEKLNTTEPIRTESWRDKKVGIMIERPSFKIHTIENFVTHEECMAVSEMAEPLLEDAEVADGSGGGQISENRKAKQAAIAVDWEKEAEGDLIAQLSRRVYDYVNHALPFEIKENGQEELMSIQYFGRGRDDDQPRDQYMPHCDEDCTGMAFRPGTRMATIVMYCEVPTVGGATNFRNAMVHIKPTKHAATFFSYIDPVTMMTDSGFTEHSGCPVIEGNKKIVTQWVRLGVDDETPWDSFNTREYALRSACVDFDFVHRDRRPILIRFYCVAFFRLSGCQNFRRGKPITPNGSICPFDSLQT